MDAYINIGLIIVFALVIIAFIIYFIFDRYPSKNELEKENIRLKHEAKQRDDKILALSLENLEWIRKKTPRSAEPANEELVRRNDTQAEQLRELRSQIAEYRQTIHERDKEIARLNKRIGELENTDAKEFTRRAEIELEKRKEELKAREEARIQFSREFRKSLKGKIDFEYLRRGMANDAFSRVLEPDNSILSLVSLDTFNVSATINSKKSENDVTKYKVNLKECSCKDFEFHGTWRPCKHVVYLAYALGLLQQDVVCNQNLIKQYNAIREHRKKYKKKRNVENS